MIAFNSDRPGRELDMDMVGHLDIVTLIRMGRKGRLISGWRLEDSLWGSEVNTLQGLRPLQSGQCAEMD